MLDINTITSQLSGAGNGNAAASEKKLADDFDTFLKMLVTQLQSQDPLDPTDSSEFTNQLVQFTSIEQSIQQNKNLETLANISAFNSLQNTVGFIGKMVTVEQNAALLKDGAAKWQYNLGTNSNETRITVVNDKGQEVYSTLGNNSAGQHEFNWNGQTAAGTPLPDGVYSMRVAATDPNGNTITSQVFMEELVDSVDLNDGQSVLSVGGFDIPVDNVSRVRAVS